MNVWRQIGKPHVVFPCILLLIMVVLIIDAAGYPSNPRQLPMAVAILTAVLCLIQIFVEVRKNLLETRDKQTVHLEPHEKAEKKRIRNQIIACFVAMPLFLLVNYLFGFLIASIVFIGGLSWYLGFRRKIRLIAWSIGIPVFEYAVFVYVLKTHLPNGLIWGWFNA